MKMIQIFLQKLLPTSKMKIIALTSSQVILLQLKEETNSNLLVEKKNNISYCCLCSQSYARLCGGRNF